MRNRKKKLSKSKGSRKPRDVTNHITGNAFRLEIEKRVTKKVKRRIKGKLRNVERTIYKKIPTDEFRKNTFYRIYLIHKRTNQRRLLGFGKFNQLPITSTHPDTQGRPLGGRWFRPNKEKIHKKGKWVPVSSIIGDIEKELEEFGQNYRHEVRGAIIPPKNYFHVDWLVFSDKPLPGKTVWKKFGINCVIEYVYTNMQWIGKRTVVVDTLDRGIQIRNLHKYKERWKFELETKLDEFKQNRRGEINVIEINGFVPVAYIPGENDEEN